MGFFARAVLNGVGFTIGALLVRKFAKQLGIEDPMYPQPKMVDVTPPQSS
jgi:hypothetical protein